MALTPTTPPARSRPPLGFVEPNFGVKILVVTEAAPPSPSFPHVGLRQSPAGFTRRGFALLGIWSALAEQELTRSMLN